MDTVVADDSLIFRVLHPNVLVELDSPDETTPSGIILPGGDRPCTGVVKMLPDTADGKFAVSVGSRVVFNPSVARTFVVEGRQLSLVSWYDIDAVVSPGVSIKY